MHPTVVLSPPDYASPFLLCALFVIHALDRCGTTSTKQTLPCWLVERLQPLWAAMALHKYHLDVHANKRVADMMLI